jgi:biotin operon repressor
MTVDASRFVSPDDDLEPKALKDAESVVVDDDFLRQGFTILPNVILRDPRFSFGAKLCYAVLLSYAWQKDRCFPGQDRLAADLGVTPRSVKTYLRELRESGIVEVTQRGLTKTNVYRLPRLIGDPRKP